jgi:hypothetical protein
MPFNSSRRSIVPTDATKRGDDGTLLDLRVAFP